MTFDYKVALLCSFILKSDSDILYVFQANIIYDNDKLLSQLKDSRYNYNILKESVS
jgi:hypothetical protein